LISISDIKGDGGLILIDVEAVGRGIASLSFDREALRLVTVNGKDLHADVSDWRGLVH
jgi:hypothetical protein